MSRVRLLNLGSKKRVARIRWSRSELLQVIALLLLMAGLSVWLACWLNLHPLE
jgi:hypothetical protein